MATAIKAGEPGTLHVVPSTDATLAAAGVWAREAQWQVVGLPEEFRSPGADRFEPQTPAQFLASCRQEPEAASRRHVVVFTDQFVSAEHAPLLVRDGADEMFYPTLELVAAARYGFVVCCWDGEAFAPVPAAASAAESGVLPALRDYYRACDALGAAWRMRGRQHQRSPAGRVEAARHRLRLYQSIVMLAPDADVPAQTRLPLLEALIALQQQLPKVAAP
jgi:hypothetical protein